MTDYSGVRVDYSVPDTEQGGSSRQFSGGGSDCGFKLLSSGTFWSSYQQTNLRNRGPFSEPPSVGEVLSIGGGWVKTPREDWFAQQVASPHEQGKVVKFKSMEDRHICEEVRFES